MKIITRVLVFTLSILVSLFASTVHATPIVTTAPCVNNTAISCATGITDLDIMGMLFDVSFSQLSYNNLFASSDPYFLGDPTGAAAAADAIAASLNHSVIGTPLITSSFIFIPYATNSLPTVVNVESVIEGPLKTWTSYSSPFSLFPHFDLSSSNPDLFASYAMFTKQVATIPAPATLALLGMGLVGIGAARRKRGLRRHITQPSPVQSTRWTR